MGKKDASEPSVRDALRVRRGRTRSFALAPDDTPVGPGSKAKAAKNLDEVADELAGLQEALYAEGVTGGERRVLLVLQGMDTSGKGGTIRHVCGLVNPQGLSIASFKKPTVAERRHPFLWRIRRELPAAGQIGVFDRSHYEDVLVPRVENLVPEAIWRGRYDEINEFEAELTDAGTTIVKCFLHISKDEQAERIAARLNDPTKQWKHNPGDLNSRAKWDDYQAAYAEMLSKCSTRTAPWYVIPANRKWYRNWAVANLLLETLRDMKPQLPGPDYDVEEELARLQNGGSSGGKS
ncbi:PPK2 family polyphosphate:nucleotide phosphotransferase [Herbihabitans rhizosphaerae]|uniref:PPK2 family polyphosphate:nucleotide phosphotransferase n=1 Tax=Herbihabitans rhizosphaerae TaxID=1872711 RepID=A0A4Q7L336_9PSEU|nr:PPK2 family polyphosphate kinase [Herbihabitans rhizosphaerae]RZS43647.1 PPK2 family polyphosphate:nucleotide phosphotransferase [Herbihabitans rhizosphaerae]